MQRKESTLSHGAIDWSEEQARAVSAAIDAPRLSDALCNLRSGVAGAKRELVDGLAWLVFEYAMPILDRLENQRIAADEIIGSLYIRLDVIVDRLANNDVSEAGVAKYVKDELWRTRSRSLAEIRSAIVPPSSTNSTRRKQGKSPYRPLRKIANRRLGVDEFDTGRTSFLDIHDPPSPAKNASGIEIDSPDLPYKRRSDYGKYSLGSTAEYFVDRRLTITDGSKIEARILELADAGWSIKVIRAITSLPFKQIKRRLHSMRRKAKRHGFQKPPLTYNPDADSELPPTTDWHLMSDSGRWIYRGTLGVSLVEFWRRCG